jgi:uncharacterized RDD family membrane protein YckC
MAERFEKGDTVGSYLLDDFLGGGGFAEVWRARHTTTGQVVALKLLTRAQLDDQAINMRAEIELLAGTAAQGTPHLVRVLDGGVSPVPFVVMEMVRGSDLGVELRRGGRLSQHETLRVGLAVAEALAALHSVGIIHRDVKPANVLLDATGTIKLADFGIAKIVGYDSLTMTGQGPFSPYYAAPEAWGGHATTQSDLYSFGAMLHECLGGVPPFTGSLVELLVAHREHEPNMSALPDDTVPALMRLIHDCMEKDPALRPATAADCLAELRRAEQELQARERPAGLQVPAALGPWRIEAPHPHHPWLFHCSQGTTTATVEVHFNDGLSYGDVLRTAVEANARLVPLGAERLLGTSRLILRPGEGWQGQPPGRFQFWVAREELPVPPEPPASWTAGMLERLSGSLAALEQAAARLGVPLDFAEATALHDGRIYVQRPGLPPLDPESRPRDAQGFVSTLGLPDGRLPPPRAGAIVPEPDEMLTQPEPRSEALWRPGSGSTVPAPPPPQIARRPPPPGEAHLPAPPPPTARDPFAPAQAQRPPAPTPRPAQPSRQARPLPPGQALAAYPRSASAGMVAVHPSRARRFSAALIDGVLLLFAVGAVAALFGGVPPIVSLILFFVASVAYAVGLEGSSLQGTFGKRLLGLRAVKADGGIADRGMIARRALIKTPLMLFTGGLGMLVYAFGLDGQTFYDRVTGIVVVHERPASNG